jgi:hypothetical protein
MNKTPFIAAVSSFLMFSNSYAVEFGDLTITFNGFGSAVSGVTQDSGENYLGYDDDPDFDLEVLALQTNVEMENGLSFVTQFVVRGADDYDLETEWAYVGYQINSKFKMNVGRIRLPLYMYSDYLEVGYAYPWMRPPASVYFVPATSVEAGTLFWTEFIGDWESQVQFTTDAESKHGVNWSMTYDDWLTLRVAYFETDLSIDVPPVTAAAAALDPLLAGNLFVDPPFDAEAALTNKDAVIFSTIGMKAEWGKWFLIGEFANTASDPGILPDQDRYYVSVGRRLGESFQLYGVYGKADDDAQLDSVAGIPTAGGLPDVGLLIAGGFNPFNTGALMANYGILTGVISSANVQSTDITFGARFDFHESAAAKLEVTSHSDELNSSGDATLINLGIDVLF